MAAKRSTSLVGITRAGLTVAVALGLTTVFAERAWLGAALVAAIAPHALIAWTDRRRFPLWISAIIVAGTGFVFTLYAVVPHTTRRGFPTGETFSVYGDHLANLSPVLRTAVVPVVATGSALLLALIALYCAGAFCEFAARRFDASLGAIGPSLVLFVSIAALGDGGWAWATIAYGLAVALYLVALHQDELTERRSWFHGQSDRGSRVLQGGILAAIVVVLAGALFGPLLPGARSAPWFDYRALGDGDGGGGLLEAETPIVSIRAKLLEDPEKQVFTVDIGDERPTYWRVIALDNYDGELWTLEDTGEPADELRPPRSAEGADELVQEFTLLDADPHWLPAAYHPVEINLENALYVPESATLYLKPDAELVNLSYEVTSAVPDPLESQKDAAPPALSAGLDRYRELPENFPSHVERLAREITEDASTPWEQADTLARYLNSTGGFTYDAEVARSHSIDRLDEFLFEDQTGYCEQFASAFAAMARSLGLPTRIAVGYSYGTPESGEWVVRNKDAHAWPEVFFTDLGWIALEPTPGRGANGEGGTGDATERPDVQAEDPETDTSTTTAAPGATTPQSASPGGPRLDELEAGGGAAGAATEETSSFRQFLIGFAIFLGVLFLLVLIAIAVLTFVAYRRSWRRRHAPDARDRVLGAWAQALEHLSQADVELKPSATPVEFALRHAPRAARVDAGPALMELAKLQTAALFAPEQPTAEDADAAWKHVDAIDRAIGHQISPWVRWRRRLDYRRWRPPRVTPRLA